MSVDDELRGGWLIVGRVKEIVVTIACQYSTLQSNNFKLVYQLIQSGPYNLTFCHFEESELVGDRFMPRDLRDDS